MAEVIKAYNAGWILMHSGECKSNDFLGEIKNGLKTLLNSAIDLGVERNHICLDAGIGIGFGKNHAQNYAIQSIDNSKACFAFSSLLDSSSVSILSRTANALSGL